MEKHFYIDPSRCIGCNACVTACAECDTHAGVSMIHLETIMRGETVQTTPIICMHCEEPACAMVCPADAIKRTPDGVVQSSLKPRCIGCTNCVYACPFGVPKYDAAIDQMMKLRHVLRPHVCWKEADVCDCVSFGSAVFWHTGGNCRAAKWQSCKRIYFR